MFSSKNVPLDVKNLNKAIIKKKKTLKNYLAKKSCKGKIKAFLRLPHLEAAPH